MTFEKAITFILAIAFAAFIIAPSFVLPFIWFGSIVKNIFSRVKSRFEHGKGEFKVQYTYDDKKGSCFKVPLIFYTFSFFPIVFFTLFFALFFDYVSSYLFANILYFVLLFASIRLFYGKDDNHTSVNLVLESHIAYLQASFIPLSFFIALSGVILSFMGVITELQSITFSINELNTLLSSLFSKYDLSSNTSFASLAFFIIIFVIASLPTQFFAYLALRIYQYSIKYGSPYWVFFKKTAKELTK